MNIALSYTGSPHKHAFYEAWLRGTTLGKQPGQHFHVVELSSALDNLNLLQNCQGLVLSGGLDIHPSCYGGATGYAQQPAHFDADRDAFETAAFKQAMHLGLPVLGICRGLQLINCILGGTLVQDLGPARNAVHQFHHYDKAHGINLEPNTQLHEALGHSRLVANSAHHQCIETLGHNLRSNCHADDGTIEGIEWANPAQQPFMMAVQWHPERMHLLQLQDAPLAMGLRNHFINAIQKHAATHAYH